MRGCWPERFPSLPSQRNEQRRVISWHEAEEMAREPYVDQHAVWIPSSSKASESVCKIARMRTHMHDTHFEIFTSLRDRSRPHRMGGFKDCRNGSR